MRPRCPVLLGLGLASLLASGCGERGTPAARFESFRTAVRLRAHQVTGSGALLERDTVVTIGGVRRRVLRSTRAVKQAATCLEGARAPLCGVQWSLLRGAVAALVVVPEGPAGPHRLVFPAPDVDPQPAPGLRHAVRGLLPPEAHDVLTGFVPIPAGARFRAYVGIEEGAWTPELQAVEFTAGVLPRGEEEIHELLRLRLDPARVTGDRAWVPIEVSLGAVAGREVLFSLQARPAGGAGRPWSLPVWAEAEVVAPEPRLPRVVLVSLDTLRAKSVGCYGAGPDASPTLDALAAAGTWFALANAPWPNTLGSHMSLFTGLYPRRHGVVHERVRLAPDRPTLPERLAEAGYATAAFTEDGLLLAEAGFERGFDHYEENRRVEGGMGDAAGTFAQALAWAREHRDRLAFLFVHTYQVHKPYEPPFPIRLKGTAPDDLARYGEEVRYLDGELAGLLAGLEALWPGEQLLLVVTADHGEEFGEHGLWLHIQLFDEVMRVPLLLRWPGVVPPGARVDAPVSLVDVAPTVLGLLGLAPLPAGDGLNLAAAVTGGARIERSAVLAEGPRVAGWVEETVVARDARRKCLWSVPDDRWSCYDVAHDPDERQPIDPEHLEVAPLRDLIRAHAAGAPSDSGASAVPPPPRDVQDKLRALGYVH